MTNATCIRSSADARASTHRTRPGMLAEPVPVPTSLL